jgi:hypothetical protein
MPEPSVHFLHQQSPEQLHTPLNHCWQFAHEHKQRVTRKADPTAAKSLNMAARLTFSGNVFVKG